MKKVISLVILLNSIAIVSTYSQKIKTISEFKSEQDTVVILRTSVYNKDQNLIEEIKYGSYDKRSDSFRNRYKKITYARKKKIAELNCVYLSRKDTCITIYFSNFTTDRQNRVTKEINYSADFLIRFVREYQYLKHKVIQKTYSWEFIPVESIDKATALVLIDTVYLDEQNRKTQIVHFNQSLNNSWKELITYHDEGYLIETVGTALDKITDKKYHELREVTAKRGIDYNFNTDDKFSYKIEYY